MGERDLGCIYVKMFSPPIRSAVLSPPIVYFPYIMHDVIYAMRRDIRFHHVTVFTS